MLAMVIDRFVGVVVRDGSTLALAAEVHMCRVSAAYFQNTMYVTSFSDVLSALPHRS